MIVKRAIMLGFTMGLLTAPAYAQGYRAGAQPLPPSQPNEVYRGPQGVPFQNDETPFSHDRKAVGRYDDRYSETLQQQKEQAEKPGGGCLKYGLAGAVGGHFAGHGVMGALAGCATGIVVRHNDKKRISQDAATRQTPQTRP